MKTTFAALALALLVPTAAVAQDAAPATQPTTQPASVDAAPAVQLESKVLIVPFTTVEATDPDWIGRAVQQSLLADLSRGNGGTPMQAVGDATPLTSVEQAIEAGKKANARYVIFGSYQRIEPTLRITGQIVDVSTGKVVAGLKSTGSSRDLFEMQDTLAFQAKWGLGTERLAEKAKANPPAERPTIQPQGPVALAGDRYAESELSRAVADGRSLIERNDAAGRSYRDNYYDDASLGGFYPAGSYYGGYYPGFYGYGGGWPYNWWWWGGRTVVISGGTVNCDPQRPDYVPFKTNLAGGAVPTVGSRNYSVGQGNTMGSYPMTMQGAERNYNLPTPRGSSISPPRFNTPAPVNNGPARTHFNGGGARVSTGGGTGMAAPRSAPAPRAAPAPRTGVSK
jgi:TolB-like protein